MCDVHRRNTFYQIFRTSIGTKYVGKIGQNIAGIGKCTNRELILYNVVQKTAFNCWDVLADVYLFSEPLQELFFNAFIAVRLPLACAKLIYSFSTVGRPNQLKGCIIFLVY